jgi:PEGA domain
LCGPAAPKSAAQEQNLVLRVLQTDQIVNSVRSSKVESQLSCSISGTPSPDVEKSHTKITGPDIPWISNSYPGLSMHCSSERQSAGWRHVLNTMLVVASDGNAYVLGCEAAFRWSQCKGLQTGGVFRASRTDRGLTVFAADLDGKATEIDFRVLNSKSLKPEQAQSPSASGPGKPQASGTGTVTVFCSQVDAEIYVDGKFAGNPPVMLDLPEGPHAFEVKSEGFTAWERKLEVLKNSAVTLNATLDKAR